VPKIFRPIFDQVTLEELKEFSKILLRTLARLAEVLDDPNYNSYYTPPRLGTKTRTTFCGISELSRDSRVSFRQACVSVDRDGRPTHFMGWRRAYVRQQALL
jgi:hypothetical protein